MKWLYFFLSLFLLNGCQPKQSSVNSNTTSQDSLMNSTLKSYSLLKCMYDDGYFPDFLVDKVKAVLIQLCADIESSQPKNLDELYKLTHSATEKINDLETEFLQSNSELETVARECIAENFEVIAHTYGFKDADIEALIAPRNW